MFRRKGPSDVEIARENEIKIAITQELSKALKNVQKENVDCTDQNVYSTDTANSVCHCLEAVFLHGIKASSVKKIANMVGLGQQAISQPSLNFWNFALKFTHSEVISQLKHLGQITSEIGLCRAWVRVALNDCLIESYVDAMVSDKKTLDYFYHKTAYLRDREQPEIMKNLIHGLMTFEFKLSYNSSVLNEWSYAPLRLSGILNVNDAPLPVIKPAGPRPQKTSQTRQAADTEVQSIRPGSKAHREDRRKSKVKNPMEQPAFGAPSENSYYVSSSEFTSKDVEDFKRLAAISSPSAPSECSSSSHMSYPDPPHMNLSPAAYIQNRYIDYTGSPVSSRMGASDGSYCETDGLSDRLGSTGLQGVSVNSGTGDTHTTDPADHPVYSQTSKQMLDEIYSEMKQTEDLLDGHIAGDEGDGKNDLEESWEEFYKSPVKKNPDKKPFEKTFQRLESFQQEIKEKQILESFIPSDDESKETRTQSDSNKTGKSDDISFPDLDSQNTSSKSDVFSEEEFDQVMNKIQQEVRESIEQGQNTSIQDDGLGIINHPDVLSRHIATDSDINKDKNVKQSDDETSSIPKNLSQGFIEEKVCVSHNDDEQIEHISNSPVKKRKGKSKSSASKLKPSVSLSPPDSSPLTPELSDAVAVKVDRIPRLENPDYLSRHRMSLPVASKPAPTPQPQGKNPRKSLPDVLEDLDQDENAFANLQCNLGDIYDGKPLDQDQLDEQIEQEEDEALQQKMMSAQHRQSIGNNLMLTGRGWSSSFDSELEDTTDAFSPPRSMSRVMVDARPKSESFGTMLQNYTPASSVSARSIDDVLQHFPRKDTVLTPSTSNTRSMSPPEEVDYMEDFEVVSESHKPDSDSMEKLTQVVEIANEKGLDAQNFQCKGCSRALGLIFGKPRVCKYDGGYYCYECHESEEYYIPAIILHNWDFRKHKVCKKNLAFLQEIEEQPYINVDQCNPRLYDHVPEMQEIRSLRQQLMYLKTYLFTCKQSIAEDLHRLVWPRDYLYDNMELYSLADLLQVPSGALASSIRKVIKFAMKHVYSCPLCNQKGFICEICNNPKVIYPFEMDTTYRCPQCKTVFHKDCKTDNRPCPKCQRRLLRESTHGISESVTTPVYDYVMP